MHMVVESTSLAPRLEPASPGTAMAGFSPASATTYDYDLSFAVGTISITGSIVTDCDSCALLSSDVTSWTIIFNGSTTITGVGLGPEDLGLPVLVASPNAIIYDPIAGAASFGGGIGITGLGFFQPDPPNGEISANIGADAIQYDVIDADADFTIATTPLPAALPLFASGLGALGLFGWRRKRKNAVAFVTA
jgi:hypothetical protein